VIARSGHAGNVFGGAWRLFVTNVGIVVPGLVAGAVVALASQMLADSPLASDGVAWLLLDVTQIVAAILAISSTTGMAVAAWRLGHATFADGRRAFRREGAHVFVAMLALIFLGAVAAVVAAYTYSLSLVAYAYFCVYTMAAAVVGERPGVLAVVESAKIAFARPLPTIVTVAGVFAVIFGMGALALGSASLPLLGPLISDLVVQAVIAYAVLVVVGEYRLLRGLTS
jgi:hypothetical protein